MNKEVKPAGTILTRDKNKWQRTFFTAFLLRLKLNNKGESNYSMLQIKMVNLKIYQQLHKVWKMVYMTND